MPVRIRRVSLRSTICGLLPLVVVAVSCGIRQTNAETPTVISISQTGATAGSDSITLVVDGSGFGNETTVQWNGLQLPTSVVSKSKLTVTVPASQLTSPGIAKIVVISPSGSSTPTTFTVVANKSDLTRTNRRSAALRDPLMDEIWKV